MLTSVELFLVFFAVISIAISWSLWLQIKNLSKPLDFTTFDLKFDNLEKGLERTERMVREELQLNRTESSKTATELRMELLSSIKTLTESSSSRQEALRQSLEKKFIEIQDSNSRKLDEIRLTVDEKLHGTLESRLGQTFKLVTEKLEQVQRGIGEMQSLATGVGDLRRVLTNVKTRGTWGEIQLGNLLEEMLSPDQFERNVQIRKRSPEVVEFAVRLPGQDESIPCVFLPIDSKFPMEDYERLQIAQEKSDQKAAEEARLALEAQIRKCARDIRDKYIHPPYSTDFGIMFLPVESLFSEVLRIPGLLDSLQREYRVTVTGPTTLSALLNSLQMGFKTLAIQKSSSEVWKILATVKNEFGKFGDILDKVKKQLEATQNTIGDAASKSRNIERKLKSVEVLPSPMTSVPMDSKPGILPDVSSEF